MFRKGNKELKDNLCEKKIFSGPVTTVEIDSKHLPSDEVMVEVCQRAKEFFELKE